MGEGSSCCRDMKVSCDAVDARRSMINEDMVVFAILEDCQRREVVWLADLSLICGGSLGS